MDAKYDSIANWYDELVENDDFTGRIIAPTLWDMLGDVNGQYICDLACGQGRLSRQLAEQGAVVTGIDLSAELIAIAKQKSADNSITYLIDNAETLTTIEDNQFNQVVCNLAIMDIPNIEQAFASVHRILKSGGTFIFSLTHPCFEAPHAEWIKGEQTISRLVHTYTDEGVWYSSNTKGVRGQVGAHHRKLSTYINCLIRAGFMIERIEEPLMPQDTNTPTIGHQVIPAFMLIKCRSTTVI